MGEIKPGTILRFSREGLDSLYPGKQETHKDWRFIYIERFSYDQIAVVMIGTQYVCFYRPESFEVDK